jgi:hypothetical protein
MVKSVATGINLFSLTAGTAFRLRLHYGVSLPWFIVLVLLKQRGDQKIAREMCQHEPKQKSIE